MSSSHLNHPIILLYHKYIWCPPWGPIKVIMPHLLLGIIASNPSKLNIQEGGVLFIIALPRSHIRFDLSILYWSIIMESYCFPLFLAIQTQLWNTWQDFFQNSTNYDVSSMGSTHDEISLEVNRLLFEICYSTNHIFITTYSNLSYHIILWIMHIIYFITIYRGG